MGQLKEKYERFKQWQQQPLNYINSEDEHHCNNCGYTFTGNYCPCCSQKAELGRIGWRSVHQGVMDIWGLGSRSLVYSLWQLLWRPGYLISDYISGKRQVSFPPVKMLFILAVIYSFLAYWFFPEVMHMHVDTTEADKEISQYYSWLQEHFSWQLLMMSVLAIIPTWIMFRHSPRHTRHTIPEGFFIQVFLQVIQLVIGFLVIPFAVINLGMSTVISAIFIILYYFVTYKQLFGYNWWGTLWRQGFISACILCLEGELILLFSDSSFFEKTQIPITSEEAIHFKLLSIAFILIATMLILAVGYAVNQLATRKARRRVEQL